MKATSIIIDRLKTYTQYLIESQTRLIMGVIGIENEDELKGAIKALQWVLSDESS